MVQRIKTLLVALGASGLFLLPLAIPAMASAQPAPTTAPDVQAGVCQGSTLQFSPNPTPATCAANTAGGVDKVNSLITTAVNIFSIIVGIVAVIMIIIGGLKYITSSGDSSNISSAKNTIIYAVIGLVVVALAQFIVKFVLAKTTA
jgi:hypothetical protein